MKTKDGKYIIFDITEFLPGKPIPDEFCKSANEGGPFFFMPSTWTEELGWGTFLAQHRGYPMNYSPGFETAEAAAEAATAWEVTRQRQESQSNAFLAWMGSDDDGQVFDPG